MGMAGIALGIVDREIHAGDTAAGRARAAEGGELAVIEPGTAGRIDGRHDFLVQHVEVHVDPGAVESAGFEPSEYTAGACVDAFRKDVLHVEPGDLCRDDVAV